ncbi:MAG: hypothetical protein GDA56_06300 [Hormoscilla sp. GM7CHS1pb]|nr:hypothetical protein [Hormoscilla sp. GM7CHS1pb]
MPIAKGAVAVMPYLLPVSQGVVKSSCGRLGGPMNDQRVLTTPYPSREGYDRKKLGFF